MTKSMAFMLRLLTQITTWLTAQLARIRDWFFCRREHVEPKPITRAERRRRMRASVNIRLCPFCGGQAHVKGEPGAWGFPSYEAVCGGCGARSDSYPNKEDVVEAWNRRVGTEVAT